jgi:ankyrin repeat protein
VAQKNDTHFMKNEYFVIIAVFIFFIVGCGKEPSTKANPTPTQPTAKLETNAVSPPLTTNEAATLKQTADTYRQVSLDDNIQFYSRMQSEAFLDGKTQCEGFEFGIIGDDGKEIGIALVSTTVIDGKIETKDFGILKIEAVNPGINRLFATDSQIKKLRALRPSLAFLDLVQSGDLEQVKARLKDKPDLVFSKDVTPLHWAAQLGLTEMAKLLLANKAEVNALDSNGNTPLCDAAVKGYKNMVELLLAQGADVDARGDNGATPLSAAANQGKTDVAELLLANKAEVNAKDKIGISALHYAAGYGHKDMVELLLAQGRYASEAKAALDWADAIKNGAPESYIVFHKNHPNSAKLTVRTGAIKWGHGMHRDPNPPFGYVLDNVTIGDFSASVSIQEAAILGVIKLRQNDNGSVSVVMEGVNPPLDATVLFKDGKVVACQSN